MKNITYENESQFITDLSNQMQKVFSQDYKFELNKKIGLKEVDLVIHDKKSDQYYLVEVKGRPDRENLPPEIIPFLKSFKNEMLKNDKYHFILFSLSDVNSSIKHLFEDNNIHLFEYKKHRKNVTYDFMEYLRELEK